MRKLSENELKLVGILVVVASYWNKNSDDLFILPEIPSDIACRLGEILGRSNYSYSVGNKNIAIKRYHTDCNGDTIDLFKDFVIYNNQNEYKKGNIPLFHGSVYFPVSGMNFTEKFIIAKSILSVIKPFISDRHGKEHFLFWNRHKLAVDELSCFLTSLGLVNSVELFNTDYDLIIAREDYLEFIK